MGDAVELAVALVVGAAIEGLTTWSVWRSWKRAKMSEEDAVAILKQEIETER